MLQTNPSLVVCQALDKCIKEKDNTWLDKFMLSGGVQALVDLIALKESLDAQQRKTEDTKVRGGWGGPAVAGASADGCSDGGHLCRGSEAYHGLQGGHGQGGAPRWPRCTRVSLLRARCWALNSPFANWHCWWARRRWQRARLCWYVQAKRGEVIRAAHRCRLQQLLSAACLNYEAKPPGHRQVTDALEHYRTSRREKGRFETIVQSLKQSDDESYLVTVIKVWEARQKGSSSY